MHHETTAPRTNVWSRWKERHLRAIARLLPPWIHADHITVARALLAAPIVLTIGLGYESVGFAIFIIAEAFDLLDGPLARLRHQTHPSGVLFDPIVDRFVSYAVLFTLGWTLLPHTILWVLVGLEILYGGARLLRVLYPHSFFRQPAAETTIGKIKSFLFFVALVLLFYALVSPVWIFGSVILFAVTIVLTIFELEIEIQSVRGKTSSS